jgi:hypothetical protein
VTYHARAHPVRLAHQTEAEHKREMASWMGYGTIEEMDRDHDPLHAEMSQWMGATSYSLLHAQGVKLTLKQQRLAQLEENAVLAAQRWLANLRQEGEEVWLRF